MAERQGFEPWEGYPSTVFKTAAFDHSATSPVRRKDTGLQRALTRRIPQKVKVFQVAVSGRGVILRIERIGDQGVELTDAVFSG